MNRLESYLADEIHYLGTVSRRQEGREDSKNSVFSSGKWLAGSIIYWLWDAGKKEEKKWRRRKRF